MKLNDLKIAVLKRGVFFKLTFSIDWLLKQINKLFRG
jgi:hypothetical protein